jgi:hypothetical protein
MLSLTNAVLDRITQPPTATMNELRICSHIHGHDTIGRWFPESRLTALVWAMCLGNINYGAESHRIESRIA